MSIARDGFVVGIYYDDKQFQPKQLLEYFSFTDTSGYANPEKLKALCEASQEKVKNIMKEHSLGEGDSFSHDSSEVGRQLATIALNHCDQAITLIVSGGHSRGVLI